MTQAKQQVELQTQLPEIASPTGLAARSTLSEAGPSQLGPRTELGRPAETPSPGGRQHQPFETEHDEGEGPKPGENISVAAQEPEEEEGGSWWSWLFDRVKRLVRVLPTTDPGLSTSAGARPTVDLTGEADPAQNEGAHEAANTALVEGRSRSDLAMGADFGEQDIYPRSTGEILRPSHEPGPSPRIATGPTATLPAMDPEVRTVFDDQAAPWVEAQVGDQTTQYASAHEAYNYEVSNARAEGDRQLAVATAETRAEQEQVQLQAKTDVDAERGRWQEENATIHAKYDMETSQGRLCVEEEIQKTVGDAQEGADKKLSAAENEAATKRRNAERRAADKRREVDNKPRTFWDKLKGAVGSFFEKVTQQINNIFDDLRRAVKTLIQGAKLLARGLIETARKAVVGLVKGFGSLLKTAASVALAAFPGAAKKARAWIDEKVSGAVEAVNQAADELQKRAQAALDFVAEAADEALSHLQNVATSAIGFLGSAVAAFLDDPARFAINGVLLVLGIPPASFWKVVDQVKSVIADIVANPLGFAGNLLAAVGKGFGQFFDRIGQHLLNGLLGWLFGRLGSVGVTRPPDFSLKSIITLFLQIMGISWQRIRKLLAKHIGEKNIALVEKAWEIVTNLIELGPSGIFELLKDKLNPKQLLDQVLNSAIEFVVEALIKKVAVRLLLLFNPAGAVLQAVEAIYRVLKWIFENAAKLFRLVETVVGGLADIVAGNIGGMANAVEKALAGLIAPVIDFLAGYLGLGNLPQKVAKTIGRLQAWVESLMDKVIKFLVDKAKSLLASLGVGKKKETAAGKEFDGEIGETRRFSVGGDSHKLWIATKGSDATVMMASKPMTITEQLEQYSRLANKMTDEAKKEATLKLIRRAETKHKSLNQRADQLAKKLAQGKAQPKATKKADDEIEKEQNHLVKLIVKIQKQLGLLPSDRDWGTPQKPLLLKWPKRSLKQYKPLYIGPKTKKYLKQSDLKNNKLTTPLNKKERAEWDARGGKVVKYRPTGQRALPNGSVIGVTPEWQIYKGKKIQLQPQEGKTPRGRKINRQLKKYGFDPTEEKQNGDHVTEYQIGGRDLIENLWPLHEDENQEAGNELKNAKMSVPGKKDKIAMSDAKNTAKEGSPVWLKIDSTAAPRD